MDGIIVGVSVGVIMMAINGAVSYFRARKSKDKEAIQLLLRCNLAVLVAFDRSGLVNGECKETLRELNEFLIKK